MSTRSKGTRNEKEFQAVLESRGFVVERVKGSTKWNKQVDFFDGNFDLIAFLPGLKGYWLLCQVKTDFRRKVYDELKSWYEKNNPPVTRVLYSIRKKKGLWREEWIK